MVLFGLLSHDDGTYFCAKSIDDEELLKSHIIYRYIYRFEISFLCSYENGLSLEIIKSRRHSLKDLNDATIESKIDIIKEFPNIRNSLFYILDSNFTNSKPSNPQELKTIMAMKSNTFYIDCSTLDNLNFDDFIMYLLFLSDNNLV